ncbi:hypothetical protein WJR50_30700 [Catalinimonas sp. 4WD22]|uniref:hypothetical protein n=1 Tax=Catalinimonas locisalis TaxID=3133978 RepID=UPI00310194C5
MFGQQYQLNAENLFHQQNLTEREPPGPGNYMSESINRVPGTDKLDKWYNLQGLPFFLAMRASGSAGL